MNSHLFSSTAGYWGRGSESTPHGRSFGPEGTAGQIKDKVHPS